LSEVPSNPGLFALSTARYAPRPGKGRALGLLLLSLFLCVSQRARAEANVPTSPSGPGLSFAIADFDGDQRPDLAAIEGGIGSEATSYLIELHLSARGLQSIRLVAPAGGLLIEARDVNGDHAVDLVVATAWFRQPVAIFLNDGHGGFSRTEPSAFPKAFDPDDSSWGSGVCHRADAVGAQSQSRSGTCSEMTVFSGVRPSRDWTSSSTWDFVFNTFQASSAGRAPPSRVSHL
jgi:hypothetical protein